LRFSTFVTQNDYNEFRNCYKDIRNLQYALNIRCILINKLIIGPISLAIGLAAYFLSNRMLDNLFSINIDYGNFTHYLVMLALVGAPVIMSAVFMNKFLVKRKIIQRHNGPIIGQHNYIFSKNCIVDKINGNIFISKLDNIINVKETYNNIVVFIDYNIAYIINKNTIHPSKDRSIIIGEIRKLANLVSTIN
jgi:hypothetical protein